MSATPKRGKFIVFEGCDHSGKTTQARLLHESNFLAPSIQIAFPDRTTPIGIIISNYLQKKVDLPDEAVHLLFTANRWEWAKKINDQLSQGISVITDRYYYSGAAYDIVKGLSKDWCLAPEQGLPVPDAVIFLDMDPKLLQLRGNDFGNERYEKVELQEKVRNAFLSLKQENWFILDASKPLEKVTEDIHNTLQKIIG